MTTSAPAARPRIFYGWYMVGGGVVGSFVAVGAGFASMSVFLSPVTQDMGWTVAAFTIATAGANAVNGMSGVIVGPLVDRHGPRPLMLVGAVALAAAMFLTSQVTALWQFIVLQAFGVGLGMALVGPLVVNIALSKWFVLGRGWAIALGSTGISFAGVFVPFAMTRVVDGLGWREGYQILGVAVLLLALPTALIMRRQPEDYGQLPDGRTEGGAGVSAADTEALNLDRLNSYTRSEALRTRAFYLLTLSFAFFGAAAFTLLIHGIPFVTEAGFTRTEAALAVGVAGVGNFAAKILWGWALGRWHPRILWAMCYALLCIGSVLQLVAGGLGLLMLMHVAFFLWGLGFGGGVPLGEFIWAKYFGRVHIGAVRSVGMPAGILFGAAGPLVASLLFDASGSYLAAWVLMIALYCLGAAAVLTSREPPQKVTAAQLAAMAPPAPAPVAAVVPAPTAAAVPASPVATPPAAAAPALATPGAALTHGGLSLWDGNRDGVTPPVNGAAAPTRSAAR
ncbi:MAG: MFS transporter [Chloroflexi bacterium]|nr:MFS transporter [Chloroflexota bacterium]MYD66384.1 MFS transporter [Chloroflexota bacterium]